MHRPQKTKRLLLLLAVSGASAVAQAQDGGWSVSAGLRAWYTEWTTFSYFTDVARDPVTGAPIIDPATGEEVMVNKALTLVSAQNKWTLLPIVSVRHGNWFGSLSAMPATRFTYADGRSDTRKEFDLNVGYSVLPGLSLTLGYKKVEQRNGPTSYKPAGLVGGVSANAPLSAGFSLYGNLGAGRFKTPRARGNPNIVEFDTDYRLTELGLAYTLGGRGEPPLWTLTAGYRIQVLSSKQAFGTQDGRDTTQGFTVGVLATF